MNHLHYQALLNKSPIDFYTLKYVICCFKMYLVLSIDDISMRCPSLITIRSCMSDLTIR